MQTIGEIICKSRIVEDDNDDVVITDFHQASKSGSNSLKLEQVMELKE